MRVIFCLPGSTFSGKFLQCWTNLISYCASTGIQYGLVQRSSCNIYYVRNMCLGGDVKRGKDQKPFNGELPYDYIMWIDSDQVFDPAQFQKLLNHNLDIVAGVYSMECGTQLATCKDWDEDFFKENGYFKFIQLSELEGLRKQQSVIEVSHTGMGFMLVKKGVFELLEYPWFQPTWHTIGNATDISMEDVAFCLRVKDKGFKVHVDLSVRVGHEKKLIL